jgi:hypothetical protein
MSGAGHLWPRRQAAVSVRATLPRLGVRGRQHRRGARDRRIGDERAGAVGGQRELAGGVVAEQRDVGAVGTSLTVSVPLALPPVGVCDQLNVVVPDRAAPAGPVPVAPPGWAAACSSPARRRAAAAHWSTIRAKLSCRT